MSTIQKVQPVQAIQTYEEKLQTLSEASVRVNFNAFVDIPWDDPAFAVVPNDPRWVLPLADPMGRHEWYRALPLDRQIELGMARMANVARVGWQFETLLIKGVLEYLVNAPNRNPEFRYLMHEITEETHHIQMFQELVNRIGADVIGAPRWFRGAAMSVLPIFARLVPEAFFAGILAGEEPIDHLQKSFLRAGDELHPAMHRVMQIHVAEEARHISFAHEFLSRRVPALSRPRRAFLSVTYPVIMRVLCDVIARPSRQFIDQYDIPREVIKDIYWRAPESRKLLRDLLADVRSLAIEAGLMNPVSRLIWRALRIDGRPSRFRGEPAPKAA